MANAGERIRAEDTTLATSPYLALVSRSTNLSLTSSATTTVTFTTETADTDGLYAAGSPDKFTIQHAGIYVAYFDWLLSSSTCLRQLAMIYVNGGEYVRQEIRDDDVFTGGGQSVTSGLMSLSASDYVQAIVLQQDSTATARNLTRAHFSILYVSDGS